jgi:hypothetical protein
MIAAFEIITVTSTFPFSIANRMNFKLPHPGPPLHRVARSG